MADQSDKTEKPTPQRVEKARREGQFATSREFVASMQFLAFMAVLNTSTVSWFANSRELFRLLLQQAFHPEFGLAQLASLAYVLFKRLLVPPLTAGLTIALISLATHLAITRFGFSFKRLGFDFKRLNPINRLRDIPRQGFQSVMQALAMLAVFSLVLYGILKQQSTMAYFLPLTRPESGVRQIAQVMLSMLWKAAALFGVFGVVDLFRQFRRHQKQMRMSKQDIRDEMKQSEGDPQIKMRVRRIQRDLRRRRMMSEVPTATAVIVNPTHYAVALKYSHDEMSTPVVVAKGKNYLALRIREKAIANHVPLVENPPLAQALYKSVDVGQEIPPHLYRAVAEILAYIYHLMNQTAGQRSSMSAGRLSR